MSPKNYSKQNMAVKIKKHRNLQEAQGPWGSTGPMGEHGAHGGAQGHGGARGPRGSNGANRGTQGPWPPLYRGRIKSNAEFSLGNAFVHLNPACLGPREPHLQSAQSPAPDTRVQRADSAAVTQLSCMDLGLWAPGLRSNHVLSSLSRHQVQV